MAHSTTQIDIPLAEQVIVVNPQPAKNKLHTLFQWIVRILPICGRGIMGRLRRLWADNYWRVPFEEGVAMPHSALGFIINALLVFVEIKSQGIPGFPFKTHPRTVMFSVTNLMMYGLASATELVVSVVGLDPTSVYAIIAHLGKVASLCILVVSLASLFYL